MKLICIYFALITSIYATHDIQIEYSGYPDALEQNQMITKVISLSDASVYASNRDAIEYGAYFTLPDEHQLIYAQTVSDKKGESFVGIMGITNQEYVEIPLLETIPSNSRATYKLYPPKKGKAIAYNPDKFKVSGNESKDFSPRIIADILVTDLVMNKCQEEETAYTVVVAFDERMMKYIEAELSLQNNPNFDPAYKIKPRFIDPTHEAKGEVIIHNGTSQVKFTIEDRTGKVIYSTTQTGTNIFETLAAATDDLNKQLCRPKSWKGTVSIEEHSNVSIPNVDPKKPGAQLSSHLSVQCNVETDKANCSVNYSNIITGSEGTASTVANGQDVTGISVSNSDGVTTINVGVLAIMGISTASFGGGSHSSNELITLGSWNGSAASSSSNKDSLSGSYKEGNLTISWSLKRE